MQSSLVTLSKSRNRHFIWCRVCDSRRVIRNVASSDLPCGDFNQIGSTSCNTSLYDWLSMTCGDVNESTCRVTTDMLMVHVLPYIPRYKESNLQKFPLYEMVLYCVRHVRWTVLFKIMGTLYGWRFPGQKSESSNRGLRWRTGCAMRVVWL